MKTSPRTIGAVAVLVLWGGSLLWLGLSRSNQSDSAFMRSQASLQLAESEAWFRVMAGTTQLGTAGVTLDTLGNGYRIREAVTLHYPTDTSLIRTIRLTDYYFSRALGFDSMVSRYSSAKHRESTRIASLGSTWSSEHAINDRTPQSGTREQGVASPLGASVAPLRAVPFRMALVGALAAGAERTLPVIAGWPGSASRVRVSSGTDSVVIFADSSERSPAQNEWTVANLDTANTHELRLHSIGGGLTMRTDQRGTLVSLTHPMGVRWEREDFNIARFNFRDRLDQSGEELRRALPTLKQLAGVGEPIDSSTERTEWTVTRRDGTLIGNAQETQDLVGRTRFSVPGNLEVAPWSMQTPVEEASDPLAATDHPEVERLATSFNRSTTPLEVAVLIAEQFVVDTSIDGAVSAAETAASGSGRPEGIARLAMAVLEKLGYRARLAVGVLPEGDTLLTHAWVEVANRRSRRWSAIDPVFGKMASTSLVEVTGAGNSHPQLLFPLVADVRFRRILQASSPEE